MTTGASWTTLDRLLELARMNGERMIIESVAQEIASFMRPFTPGKIVLETQEDLYAGTKLIIRIEKMGTFTFPIDPLEPLDLDGIIRQLSEIYSERYVEPEGHIVLGLE